MNRLRMISLIASFMLLFVSGMMLNAHPEARLPLVGWGIRRAGFFFISISICLYGGARIAGLVANLRRPRDPG